MQVYVLRRDLFSFANVSQSMNHMSIGGCVPAGLCVVVAGVVEAACLGKYSPLILVHSNAVCSEDAKLFWNITIAKSVWQSCEVESIGLT
jgi:hypothetical protein